MEERKTVQIDYETLKKLTGYVGALSVRSWCCNEEIAKIYEKAIELGDGKAACNLGFMYQKGLIGKKNGQPNYEKAAEMYEKVIGLKGCEEAAFNLGFMYQKGLIGKKNGQPNYEKAAEMYEKVIGLKGCEEAAFNLGFMYQKGLIGKNNDQPNYEKAAEIYEKAIELGDGKAAFNLGKMYLDGVIGQLIVVEKGKEKKVSNLLQAEKLFNIAKSRAQTVEDKNCVKNILENIKKQKLESSIEEFIIYLREGLQLKGLL